MGMFVIQDNRGYYLAEGTKSRGSQAGVGRIVTTELACAMRWTSEALALDFASKEFQEYERQAAYSGWGVVEVADLGECRTCGAVHVDVDCFGKGVNNA